MTMNPISSDIRPPSLGSFDAKILEHLTNHIAGEAEILDEYRRLAASPDPPVRYLAQLIVEDEERHHRVLSELANQFRSGATSLTEQTPHVPWLTKSTDRHGLARSVRRLRRFERRDLRQLRKLARELRPIRGDSLDPVIVATLEMDTRKHLRYLRELKRIARRG
jgi:rubrerythrin